MITDSGLPSLGMATFPHGAIKASQISISNIFLNSLDGFAAGATACVGINNNPHLTSANSHCTQCVKFDFLSCERPIDCVFVLKLDLGCEYYGLGLLSAQRTFLHCAQRVAGPLWQLIVLVSAPKLITVGSLKALKLKVGSSQCYFIYNCVLVKAQLEAIKSRFLDGGQLKRCFSMPQVEAGRYPGIGVRETNLYVRGLSTHWIRGDLESTKILREH